MKPVVGPHGLPSLHFTYNRNLLQTIRRITRMWGDVQRDSRPAEYRWRPLRKFRNSISCTTSAAGVPCSNAANIGERKTWTLGRKVNVALGKIPLRGKSPRKCIYTVPPGDGQTLCTVWLAFVERHRCSNEAKTRNPLKFAGVPQTPEPISAVSGPKFIIL